MSRTLYLECFSGISGDMTVAALLDLGADEEVLKRALGSIPVKGFEIQIGRVHRAGLEVCDFAVKLDQVHENHDHDMEYLHGHSEHRSEERERVLESQITQHKHVHEHRGLQEILHIIEHADAAQGAKELAKKIFRILAEAEAKAHGVSVEEVHFHEVGAVDSIVDILAAAVCLDNLQIEEVIVPELYEGRGCIRCQHGILPVPVPAVVHIVQKHGIVLHLTKTEGELVTPTGAAIAAAVATSQSLPEHFIIQKVGLGAGKREYDAPGILRAMLIEEVADAEIKREKTAEQADVMYMLETNIDDCSGEQLGAVMEQLLEGGAADVFYTPVFMKKNRPAYQLNVLCRETLISAMETILFAGTTTIGIRKVRMERSILPRKQRKLVTRFGEAEVKVCTLPNGERRYYPEYRTVLEFTKQYHLNYQSVYSEIQRTAEQFFEKEDNESRN